MNKIFFALTFVSIAIFGFDSSSGGQDRYPDSPFVVELRAAAPEVATATGLEETKLFWGSSFVPRVNGIMTDDPPLLSRVIAELAAGD